MSRSEPNHAAEYGSALDATLDAKLRETPADSTPPEDIDDAAPPDEGDEQRTDPRRYAILRQVAVGGLGRILAAEDRNLKRTVAIKELRVATRGQARFLREAMITARLQHPSIVPLFDIGRWETGELYYSMRLVSGRPLDELIASTRTLDERLALLPHIIAVADAMAYAHSERVIHRDLKPANVMVGAFGETVVVDWGLAKDLVDDTPDERDEGPYRAPTVPPPLTEVGEVLGTPVYMAPEQAMGKPLDERADVYAIGAMLYELLTGKWPHRGASSEQVIARLIAGEHITPIEDEHPEIPRELAAIVGKAMQFERDGRYPSAQELAGDLRRFQTGQLVAAHRYSRVALVKRWLRKHSAAVTVGGVLALALSATVAVSVRSVVDERDATRAERDRLILAHAGGELERDPTATVAWLKTYPSAGAEPERARELVNRARAGGVAKYVFARDASATMGRFSPDGKWFAQPDAHGTKVVDLATGATSTLHGATHVAWAPDSTRLVIASGSPRTAALVELDGRATELAGTVRGRWRATDADVFSPDGSVVVPTIDHQLRRYARGSATGAPIWSPFAVDHYARQGERVAAIHDGRPTWWDATEHTAHALAVPSGAALVGTEETYLFVGGGEQLAAATKDGRVCVWSLRDGGVRVLGEPADEIRQLVASSDGGTLAAVIGDHLVRAWRVADGSSRTFPSLGAIADIAISDGRYVAIGLGDHRLVVVETETGDLHEVGIHPVALDRVTLSRDDRWIATDGADGTTRLWPVAAQPIDRAGDRIGWVSAVAIAPSGAYIAAGGQHALLWGRGVRRSIAAQTPEVWAVAFSGDGALLATGGTDQSIHTWDANTGAERGRALDAPGGAIHSLVVTRDGATLVSAQASGELRRWDVASRDGRPLGTVRGVRLIALSPDERTVACGDEDGNVQLVSLADGARRTLAGTLRDPITVVRFSPDGRTVAGGAHGGHVTLWDVASGTARALEPRAGEVLAIAFAGGGRHLAAASTAGDVGLWDLTSGSAITLAGHNGAVYAVGFVADGLVTGGADATVRLWSLDGAARSLLHADSEVYALATGAGMVAAGTSTGAVYRWPVSAFGAAPPTPLAPFLDELTRGRIDAQARLAPE